MQTSNIKLTVTDIPENNRARLVKIEGSLDTVTAKDLEEVFASLTDSGISSIVLDCNKLNYINTTGLVLFMKYYIKTKRRGGCLKIVSPSKNIYEVMDISGAIKLLEIYSTQEEAINSLNSGRGE